MSDKEIESELKVIRQAILECRHAQQSGAVWYTMGHKGLYQQVRLWLDKATVAVDKIAELVDDKGE